MIKLIEPDKKYLKSYILAKKEYEQNNISTYSFSDMEKEDIFLKFYNYKNEINLKENRVGGYLLLAY